MVGGMVMSMNLDSRQTCVAPLSASWKLCELGKSPDLSEPFAHL